MHKQHKNVLPPGFYILRSLKSKGLSKRYLMDKLSMNKYQIDKLFSGDLQINEHIAELLSSFLGSTEEYWLQKQYDYCYASKN